MEWNLGIEWIVIILLSVIVGVFFVLLLYYRGLSREQKRKLKIIAHESQLVDEKNKRLQEQNINLKELNDEKNNVISVVSHDLKAPLNRVFALSNLIYLSGDNLTEEQKSYMNKMNIVVRDGLDLIRNLLDIRAIEFKGVHMHIENVDVKALLDNLIYSYKPYAEKKEQVIHLVADAAEYCIESDKQYLNRIFDNLISNAVKFSLMKSEIVVSIQKTEEVLKVEVSDQGPGILPIHQDRLFQKYQILNALPTGGESSTGLGLSISKTLIDFLNGKIYHNNKEKERGSVFTVELPYQLSKPEL
jgi:signal transduction histidine kinase